MAGAGLEFGVHDPDPVQLVARIVLVQVQRRQQLLVLVARAVEQIGVVRDQDLLAADQVPGIAVHRTVEDIDLVGELLAIGPRRRIVVAYVRRADHAAQARREDPGEAPALGNVGNFMHQRDLPGQPRRRFDGGQIEGEQALGIGLIRIGVLELHVLDDLGQQHVAIGPHDRLVVVAPRRGAAIAQLVVPHHLRPRFRNREREAELGALEQVAAFQRGALRVGDRRVLDEVRPEGAACGRIHDHLVARVALQQRLVAVAELVRVLRHVGLGHGV